MTAFFTALDNRDRDQVAATLARDVRLEIPSLRLLRTGVDEVLGGLGLLLIAFPDFRYRVHSRYVAPGRVMDEAELVGTRTGPLLDSPPTGAMGAVPARVLIAHDGVVVTALTLWADGGALCELIDLPDTLPSADPLVSRLRATLPAAEGQVILAQEREDGASAVPAPSPQPVPGPPSRPRITTRNSDLKVPVPRRVRRLQAVALAAVMIGTSTVLVAWVVHGTVRTTADQVVLPVAALPPTQRPATAPIATPEAPEQVRFDSGRNEFELSTDFLFFASDSDQLAPAAQEAINRVAARIRSEHRYGRVTVTGYTDQRGSAGYNRKLSRHRANAVATALVRALGPLATRVTVISLGRGENDLLVTHGTSAAELSPNRRVTIRVPEPGR